MFILLLIATGSFIFFYHSKAVNVQASFQETNVHIEQLAIAATKAMQNREKAWEELDNALRTLKNSWVSLERKYHLSESRARQSYDLLKKSIESLQSLKRNLTFMDELSHALGNSGDGNVLSAAQASLWIVSVEQLKESIALIVMHAATLEVTLHASQNQIMEEIGFLQKIVTYCVLISIVLIFALLIRDAIYIKKLEQTCNSVLKELQLIVKQYTENQDSVEDKMSVSS